MHSFGEDTMHRSIPISLAASVILAAFAALPPALPGVMQVSLSSSAWAQQGSKTDDKKLHTSKRGSGKRTPPAGTNSPSSARSSDPLKGLNVSKCCHNSPSGVICTCFD
jgi:hypothetical protein